MTFTESKTELNIRIGDTNNVTFTDEEKTSALHKAWNDSYVVKTVWDSSLTFDASTYQYAVPTGVSVVKDIYVKPTNSTQTEPQKVASNLWEVVDGNIQFKNYANTHIPDGYILYIKGAKKLDYATDELETTGLQEYVLSLAGYNTLGLLTYKKANLFLKNDTTMNELINLRREMERDVVRERARLQREYESV